MTKDSQKAIGRILSFAKATKRDRDSRSDIKARRMRMLDARWPHFIETVHAEFREFVDTFNEGLRAKGIAPVKVVASDDSITATAGRLSVTIAGDLDALMLTMTYKTLRARNSQTSDLPFYIRLGEDDQIEIHESPDQDRLLPIDTFLVKVLSPFFSEVVKPT